MQSYKVDTPNGGRGLENEKTTLFEENLSMETSIARICFLGIIIFSINSQESKGSP